MSLFEKLNNKRYNLQEGIDSKGNVTPNPGDAAKEKSILRNYNKQQKNLSKDISQRVTAQDRQQQLFNRQYDAYDDGDLGNPNQSKTKVTKKVTAASGAKVEFPSGSAEMGGESKKFASRNRTPSSVVTATSGGKTKTIKQSEVSKKAKEFTKKINKKRTGGFENVTGEGQVKYPKTRKELIAKRKEYGIDREGNISDAGVKRYAQKTKQLSSGSNLPVTPTQKELDLAKKRAVGGTSIKNKQFGTVIGTTTGKYGGFLSRKRSSKAPSLAQIKAKIDAKNPTYTSPITGGKLPLKNTRSPVDTFLNKIKKASKQDPEGLKRAVNKFPDFPETKKLPKKVLVKTPKSIAFPQGLKPVDTKTKEGEKIARKVTKKFVTDKELLTGQKPKTFKPPVNNKSKNVFSRIKGFAKKFHQKMTQDAGFRRTSGSGRLMKDTLGGIARDVNKTRHIYKNTIRGNTFRLLNKALPGHYKTLAAAGLIAYGLSNRGKTEDDGKGNNVVTPKNPYAGKKFKNVTGTLKLGDGNKK